MPGVARFRLSRRLTTEQRIAFYTEITDDCHVWKGPIKQSASSDKRPILGHKCERINVARYVLTRKLGRSIQDGYEACHTCNNTLCIREEHLYEGTHTENMRQAFAECRTTKHTVEQVREVRRLLDTTSLTQKEIAAQTGFNVSSVSRINTFILFCEVE